MLSDRMALPAVFPNLQALRITFQFVKCDQCHIRPDAHFDFLHQPYWTGFEACVDATLHCLTGPSNLPQLRELQVHYSHEFIQEEDQSIMYNEFECDRSVRKVLHSKGAL